MPHNQFDSEFEKFSYSLGVTISTNLRQSGVKKIDLNLFLAGVQDIFEGKPPIFSFDAANDILQEYMSHENDQEAIKNLEEGYAFFIENGKRKGVYETDSGLQYMIIKEGNGNCPTIVDVVKCSYHGILLNGTVFDSSLERGRPETFPINGVIQGWQEALMMMPVGSKWKIFVPSELGYGVEGSGGEIGPNATLIFDVELLEII